MSDGPAGGRTLSALLREVTRRCGDREAVVSPARGVRWTYAELDARADRVAAACVAAGLAPGDRAVVWAANLPEWLELQHGLARAGVVLVTANSALQQREIEYVVGRSRARALFFGRGAGENAFPPKVDALSAAAAPSLALRVGLDGAAAGGSTDWAAFLAGGDAADPAAVRALEEGRDVDEPINMQYTSGTTGFPKGVMLSHRNIVENAAAIARVLRVTPADRLCLAVPLFHCFGCVIGTLVAHGTGAAMVLNDVFDPAAVLDAVAEERCSLLYGVPTMFLAELEEQRARPRDLTSLRAGIMAGAICPPAVVRDVARELHVGGIVVAYGLTEASPGVTMSRPDDPMDLRATTVGRALPDVEVRLVDAASGEDVPPGAPGELWCRGENVMIGYDDDPEATAAAITPDGWLRTGDLAERDDDGSIRIVGRIKELIIRGGENISPAEVEDALREHDGVADAAVFGIASDFFGEEVGAAVRRAPGADVGEEELRAHVAARLSRAKVPARVVFVESFPLTGSGKVQRFRLRELVEAGGDGDAGGPSAPA